MEHTSERRHRTYRKSGFFALRNALAAGGGDLDGRTSEVRALTAWKAAITEATGGEPSPMQATAVEAASGTLRLILKADAAIHLAGDRVVVGRGANRKFIALVAERSRLVRELLDVLVKLPQLRGVEKPPVWPFWSEEESAEEATQQAAPGTTSAAAAAPDPSPTAPRHHTETSCEGEAA